MVTKIKDDHPFLPQSNCAACHNGGGGCGCRFSLAEEAALTAAPKAIPGRLQFLQAPIGKSCEHTPEQQSTVKPTKAK